MTAGEALAAGVVALGLGLDDATQARLLSYLALLEKWNRTHNLTSVRDAVRMVSQHLLDSLAVLPHVPSPNGMRLVDVGSGGGLPGIPLAISRRHWHVALLDSNQKKSAFLRQAVAELGLLNAEVVMKRAETYDAAKPFDVAISRGLSKLAQFVKLAAPMVAVGGRLVAMKGVYPRAEIAALPPEVCVVAAPRLRIPGIAAERHLVILEKQGA
jgi:16S rRNA (guanine527-N7)-methyltransferase